MDTAKLSDWLQILTSVGLLIGLFAVAYELRQNANFAAVDHSRETHRNWMQVSYLEIETDIFDSLAKAIDHPNDLTAEDMFRLSAWLTMNMSAVAYMDDANHLGVATAEALLSKGLARYLFSTEFSRRWFEGNKGWLGERNVETISKVIETTPIAKTQEEVFGHLNLTDME